MKIIFLDIDGVLNADDDFGGRSKPNPTVTTDTGIQYCGISRAKVRNLAKIVEATNAQIVLVSSWKDDYEQYARFHTNHMGKYLYNKLRDFNLKILATTQKYDFAYGGARGYEITCYLKDHPEVESWVVLDDVMFSDYHLSNIKKQHLIQTSEKTGLTVDLVEKAIIILNEE